jgi:hypothetical protein
MEKRLQAFETKCLRRLLKFSYLDRKTNDFVRSEVYSLVGYQEPLLATIKRRKLAWFGHVTRHDTLSKTIMQGTLEGGRKRGRQKKNRQDNVKEWTDLTIPDLLQTTSDRPLWRRITASSALRSPRRLQKSRD